MSIRDAIERIALADARRFELRVLALQRQLLERCEDEKTCRVIQEIVDEEDAHIERLDRLAGAGHEKIKAGRTPELKGETVCEMLREILEMEQSSVAFYNLLADRTPLPAVKRVFREIADAEKDHEEKLAAHVREVCG